jgi:hypothetical protein
MAEALVAAGVEVSYRVFPEFTHDSWFSWAPAEPHALAFFERHLRPGQ